MYIKSININSKGLEAEKKEGSSKLKIDVLHFIYRNIKLNGNGSYNRILKLNRLQ